MLYDAANAPASASFFHQPHNNTSDKNQRNKKEQLTFPPQMLKTAPNNVYESSCLLLRKLE